MTSKLNTRLTAGMLVGVTVIAAGAQQAAALSITKTAHAGFNLGISDGAPSATGTLVFDGFSAPGTLTGVTMTLNSSIFGEAEGGDISGSASLSLGAGTAAQAFTWDFTAPTQPFSFAQDLLLAPNAFGHAFAPGDFTGATVSFALSMTSTPVGSSYYVGAWTSSVATLEYIYAAPVPLPAALPALLVGLGALGFAARRRG